MLRRGYIKYGLIAITSLAMLCGCSENGNDDGHNEPMSFTAVISNRMQTRATVDTARTAGSNLIVRAAEPAKATTESTDKITRTATTPDGSWPSGATVAVQQVGGSTTSYTVNSDKTITSASPLYWKDKNNISVISWYTNTYSASMPTTWSVNQDQSTSDASGYNGSDFLYASGTFTYGGGNSNALTYTHETAKVVINIVKANDVTSASSVSAVTIGTASSQIDLSGTVKNGAITAPTTPDFIKPYQTTPVDATDYVATYSALVIPQDVSGKQFIAVTVGSNTYYYKPTSLTLQGGHEYDYNVTIPSAAACPGTYYFSDGSWGTLEAHATATVHPIGVVFSSTTSAIDKAHGWTHGYAIALTNAATNYTTTNTCIWSSSTSAENGITYTDNIANQTYTYTDFGTKYYTSFITNKDGYSENQVIINSGKIGMSSAYYAIYYALNYASRTTYAAPTGSSGWYLPSIGQWYDIYVNLGTMSPTPTSPKDGTTNGWCHWYSSDNSNDTNNYSSICYNAINAYLTAISTYSSNKKYSYGTPDLFGNSGMYYENGGSNNYYSGAEYYWSSSEYSSRYAGYAYFGSNGNLYLGNDGNNKTINYFRVRPVLAF